MSSRYISRSSPAVELSVNWWPMTTCFSSAMRSRSIRFKSISEPSSSSGLYTQNTVRNLAVARISSPAGRRSFVVMTWWMMYGAFFLALPESGSRILYTSAALMAGASASFSC